MQNKDHYILSKSRKNQKGILNEKCTWGYYKQLQCINKNEENQVLSIFLYKNVIDCYYYNNTFQHRFTLY